MYHIILHLIDYVHMEYTIHYIYAHVYQDKTESGLYIYSISYKQEQQTEEEGRAKRKRQIRQEADDKTEAEQAAYSHHCGHSIF